MGKRLRAVSIGETVLNRGNVPSTGETVEGRVFAGLCYHSLDVFPEACFPLRAPVPRGGKFCRDRCRSDLAHARHSRPDSGLGFRPDSGLDFQAKVVETISVFRLSLGSGGRHRVLIAELCKHSKLLLLEKSDWNNRRGD